MINNTDARTNDKNSFLEIVKSAQAELPPDPETSFKEAANIVGESIMTALVHLACMISIAKTPEFAATLDNSDPSFATAADIQGVIAKIGFDLTNVGDEYVKVFKQMMGPTNV